jgi:arylsulfatase A-like enzyme
MINSNHDAVRWRELPDEKSLRRLHKYYAANMTLIDDQIGLVLDALERKGLLENSIVVFTSDHGDCLGDHGHIQKWTMYDCITRVPMVVSGPGLSKNIECSALLQQMDVVPMLFELAGVPAPQNHSAISALPAATGGHSGRKYVFAEHSRDNILKGVDMMQMVRSRDWKLVDYDRGDDGELYDLNADPGEINNLWNSPDCAGRREELRSVLMQWAESEKRGGG